MKDGAGPSERAAAPEAGAQRVARVAAAVVAEPPAAGLHLVATPIGNLADITLRALGVLAGADHVYCEDTRHTRHLLSHYGIERPLRSYHEHNAERERPRILEALGAGRSVALASDAGTPLISDPGYKLVREVIAADYPVVSVPGPSAALAALACSGLATDCFLFAGFLPPRPAARRARLAELAPAPATLIFFEAPSRLAAALADMAAVLGAREGAVARELTKVYEEVRRGPLPELAAWAAAAPVRGEIAVLAGPPGRAAAVSDAEIVSRLAAASATMSLSEAVRATAEALGLSRRRVYDLAIGLKRGRS